VCVCECVCVRVRVRCVESFSSNNPLPKGLELPALEKGDAKPLKRKREKEGAEESEGLDAAASPTE
jgi:hypothetical protein